MKTTFTILAISIALIFINNSFAQLSFSPGPAIGGSSMWNVYLHDYDKDGDLDAFIAGGTNYQLWINDGTGKYTLGNNEIIKNGFNLADFNKDEAIDIVANSKFYINDGSGNYNETHAFNDTIKDCYFQDIDNDGKLDIIYSNGSETASTIYILKQDADYSFSLDTAIKVNYWINAISFSDINSDNYIDIFPCASDDSSEILYNHNGHFSSGKQKFPPFNTLQMIVCDFNGDNLPDIYQVNFHQHVTGVNHPDRVYINNGDGTFRWTNQNFPAVRSWRAVCFDFNRDGKNDVFVTSPESSSYLWLNDGNGNFTNSGLSFSAGTDVQLGDINLDGKMDLFIASMTAPSKVLFNTSQFTSVEQLKSYDFKVSPNPTTGLLTVSFSTTQVRKAHVEIFNLQGTQVLSRTFSGTTNSVVDLKGHPAGMYLVKVFADEFCYEDKVIKE